MASVQDRGYNKQLLVLPFDHRGSFQEKLFGIKGKPTPEETKMIASYKTIIYEGFEKAVRSGLPKDIMGILVDEQFGTEVIQRAKASGFSVSVPAEKSGQDEFDFEYQDYQSHIEKTNPDLVKVLVRYNPEGDKEMNCRQAGRLAELSRYLEKTNRKFMFELLVPATAQQLEQCKGDKKVFDTEMRPALMVRAIRELQKSGIEADVWKLEGLDRTEDFVKVCQAAREGGRDKVGCIVLGRGESSEKVREWLQAGVNVKGVIGFAVGRTVFWEPLKAFKEGKTTREQASDQIANNYSNFCRMWLEARK
ncbi:MAG: 2-deoxy-5-keto-D-gluconate 6-phosphate aldolase domain-containing protein [Pseudomonadota bacterium]